MESYSLFKKHRRHIKDRGVQIVDFFYHCSFIAFLMICSFIDTKCGENLYMSSDPNEWSIAVQSWFEERHDFVYGVGPKSPGSVVGHYTQVKGTMKILLP